MARNVATLVLVFAFGSCMEMRETVERMVMVRTTGSDLQPAATGYIYKKESDGPASVTKMGETEVIEHFSKLYGKPEAYKAPTPADAGDYHTKEADEDKAASHAREEHIKPVVEEEHGDDAIDGIANEDYDKMFEEYAKEFDNYKKNFGDYLHGLGHYDHDIYHGYEGGKDYGSQFYRGHGDKGREEHGRHHGFEKGGAGNYHTENHGGYSISKKGDGKHQYDEADAHGKNYAHGHGYKGDDHGHKAAHSKGQAIGGFHKVYDKDEFKKDHDFYDGDAIKGGHHKYGEEHKHHESDSGGFKKGGSHESGHDEGGFKKGGYVEKRAGEEHGAGHSSEQGGEGGKHQHGDFGVKGERHGGKSYGYEIKH